MDATARISKNTSKGKLSLLQFAFIAFIMTGAGPYGIETLVSSGGVFFSLIGLAILPLIYSLPQIYMCSELSCMMPSNHGYVLWCYRGLMDVGKYGNLLSYWGVMSGLFGSGCDMANYPILIVSYLEISGMFDSIKNDSFSLFWAKWTIELIIIWSSCLINVLNINVLGNLSYIFSFLVFCPLIIGWIIALPNTNFNVWLDGKDDISSMNYGLFITMLLWLNSGWNHMGFLIGEINGFNNGNNNNGNNNSDGIRLLMAYLLAILLVFLVYLIPLWALFTLDFSDADDWKNGYLEKGYKKIWAPLGYCVLFGAFVCNFSIYNVSMAAYSRSLWAISQSHAVILANGEILVSNEKELENKLDESKRDLQNLNESGRLIEIDILPQSFIGTIWEKTGAPARAVVFQSILCSFLVFLPFWFIVECSSLVWCVSCYVEYFAFLRLRYSEPNAHRPFRVPGGMFGAWFVVGLKYIVITILLISTALTKVNLYVALFWTLFLIVWRVCYQRFKKFNTTIKENKSLIEYDNDNNVIDEANILLDSDINNNL